MRKALVASAGKSEVNMPLVKIKRFAQVTLPPEVRRKFNLVEGDYLEAEATANGILLKPVTVVEKKEAWQRLFAATESVKPRSSKKRPSPKAEEEEIADIVKEVRKSGRV